MLELTESNKPILAAILRGPVGWILPTELARDLDWETGVVLDALADLDADGWLEVHEEESGPSLALSTLGAERLGVKLIEVGDRQELRWASVGDPEPPMPRARHVCSSDRAALFDFALDPDLSPDEQAELAEESAETARRSEENPNPRRTLPRPVLLIGESLTPWPGPKRAAHPPCPACGGKPLAPHSYCLCCDRWGLDRLLAAADRANGGTRMAASPIRPRSARELQAEADAARARRKHRRNLRHQAAMKETRLDPRGNGGRPQGPATPRAEPSRPAAFRAAR